MKIKIPASAVIKEHPTSGVASFSMTASNYSVEHCHRPLQLIPSVDVILSNIVDRFVLLPRNVKYFTPLM